MPLGLHNEWRRLDRLLDTLLDAPPDQRDVVAMELSGGVETVFTELRALAAECERSHPFLNQSAAERFASLFDGGVFHVPNVLAERYRILEELGQGGMARVYRARDLKHSRDVAVKVLRPELGALVGPARFLKEIEIIAQLQHPHIVPLHDSGESDGLLYYVMAYEDGLSVRQRLVRDGTVPVVEAIAILRDVCEALTYAHAHGIVHRDIKPDNVLLAANHALVADFGIARLMAGGTPGADTQTVPGMLVGTPAYMAPEQATPNANVDHRADLYATGVLAYEMLVGKPPFVGESYDAVLVAHRTQPPVPVSRLLPAIPARLDALIMRCLEKQPADRWQNADDILRELERVDEAGATSLPLRPSFPRWRRASLAVGLAGVAMVSAAVWWRTRERLDIDPNRVAVVRFRNSTGVDSMDLFGTIIADVIPNGLARTGAVNVVPAAAVMAVTGPQSPDSAPNDIPSVARATGAGIVVTGSYFRQGDSLAVQTEIIDVARGRPLAPIDLIAVPYVDPQRAVMTVLERVAVALAGRVNPRISGLVAVSHLPMSMAAYREYAEALDLYFRDETSQALPHAYEAIRLDSTSTSALLWAALMEWGESWNLPKVDSLLRRVDSLKTQLPPYDRAHLDWLRAYLDGNLEGVLNAARRRPDLAGGSAVVQANIRLNRVDQAYALITDVMKRPRDQRHPISWTFLTQILHMRGQHERELEEARQGLAEMRVAASKPAIVELLGYETRALAALGRMEDLRRALDELHTLRPSSESFASATQELRWHGHPDSATAIGRLTVQWYHDALTDSSDRRVRLLLAQTLFELGRWNDARTAFAELAAEKPPATFTMERGLSRDIIPVAYLGIDDARRGDTTAANAVIKQLAESDGTYRFGEREYWEALIAAELGQCERTVALLNQSLEKGTSVYDGSRMEAFMFKHLEKCRAFETFRARPR
jgi:TolB-like protein/tetratricopeptide (TPR) repeat protein